MRLITDEERKHINLELLSYFDKVCRENNIHYSLSGGTLLGAVRHKGLIPWDDDVDVFMSRPEFEKLDNIFKETDSFVWVSPTNGEITNLPYGRLYDKRTRFVGSIIPTSPNTGLFLDVCVVDGLPRSRIRRDLHIALIFFLRRGRRSALYDETSHYYIETSIPMKIIKKIIRLTTNGDFWLKALKKTTSKYKFDNSEWVGNFTSQYGRKELMHRSSWDSYVELEFEGKLYEACVGWEEYLTNIFGDYMQLPPEDKRVGHHEGEVYILDRVDLIADKESIPTT